VLYTIGHSTRTEAELIALLREHEIARLVDVRTVPRSRANPQSSKVNLERVLPASGIEYEHEPALGGLRHPRADSTNGAWESPSFRGYADYAESAVFETALIRLLDGAAKIRTATMCAEAVWWRCHRRIIADWAIARGVEVVHILGPGKSEPATLTPFARVEGGRVRYPALV
jgi:uncharacterized protein (DUF488 family)